MFTGIIETLGEVVEIRNEGTNTHFVVQSSISKELKIDQSVAHNGVCLTVTEVSTNAQTHSVTAIEETLQKTSLEGLKTGSKVNLERAMPANGRFDGHIVQGHVDQTAECTSVVNRDGSWLINFQLPDEKKGIIVPKGSICIDGISLTIVDSRKEKDYISFQVAIIPYTFEHTNLNQLQTGSIVNIEFDILGKYIAAALEMQKHP